MEYETDEACEKSAAFSQTKADSDKLKPGCISGSTHAHHVAPASQESSR